MARAFGMWRTGLELWPTLLEDPAGLDATGGPALRGDGTPERALIHGTAGDDHLIGGGDKDTLYGLAGNDVLEGRGGDDKLYGDLGDDLLIGGAGGDWMDGGEGDDTVSYAGAAAGVAAALALGYGAAGEALGDTYWSVENLIGSAFNDSLAGDEKANRLEGGAGDDLLQGLHGNDLLIGGAGRDVLNGGDGDDWLVSLGGADADELIGGAGRDTGDWSAVTADMVVDPVSGYVDSGPGGAQAVSGVEVWLLGSGDDTFASGGQGDTVHGGWGDDWMADYGGGADLFDGGEGADALYGLAGNDVLMGGAGADLLAGGDGVDRIIGGAGGDWMRGDAGADTFVFEAWGDIAWDTIAEFDSGVDRIDLSGLGVSIVGAFTGVAGQMTISTGGAGEAYLQFDQDGDGWADHFVYVTGELPTAGDFILGPGAAPLAAASQEEPEAPDTAAPVICAPPGGDLMAAHGLAGQEPDWLL